ncbi:MAG: hypothetical protein ABSB63_16000 [Spirochaetia bacterium]|jgi:hypothetical protein
MMKSTQGTIRAAALGLFLFMCAPSFPANIVIPTMELITHGVSSGGLFTLQTYGNMALEVQGGYKFGGSISFGLYNQSILEFQNLPIQFLSASMTIREVFSLPLNIIYFVGQNDIFGSGSGFADFGAPPIMTRYRGFLYFPNDSVTAPIYDGMYQVQGTGAALAFTPIAGTFGVDLYLYEDTHPVFLEPGSYSGDLRFLLNSSAVKLEGFVGGTASPAAHRGIYRGGLLFYAADRNVEFLAQIGIPRWDPSVDSSLSVNLFYLLFEPRLHLGLFNIVPTFFWHPAYYNQTAYPDESGTFDVNLNLYLGDQANTTLQGGMEGNFRFQSSAGEMTFKVSPWVGFSTPGVQWTVKVNTKLWPFKLSDMLDGFVGVQAEL